MYFNGNNHTNNFLLQSKTEMLGNFRNLNVSRQKKINKSRQEMRSVMTFKYLSDGFNYRLRC